MFADGERGNEPADESRLSVGLTAFLKRLETNRQFAMEAQRITQGRRPGRSRESAAYARGVARRSGKEKCF
jgi:hypothetical protein